MSGFTLVPINGELRIHDLELGQRLGFDRARDIRKLIERHLEKLKQINHCATVARRPENGGREVTEYYLDRKQSIFICMKSETDNAVEVQMDIVRVYDAHLSGEPTAPALNPANLSRLQLIELAMQAEQERLALESKVAIIQPKAEALDRIATASDGSMCMTEAAKMLQIRPIDLKRWLQVNQWVYRRNGNKNLLAYQERIHQGVLEHKVHVVRDETGVEQVHERLLITPKGLAKLARIFQVQTQPALELEGEPA